MTEKKKKPDYSYWAKPDHWSYKEAAMLLHGFEPFEYRSLGISEREIPPEFKKVQKTYFLLQKINWKERHPYHTGEGLSPLAVVREAVNRELPLLKSLHELVMRRFEGNNEEMKKITAAIAQTTLGSVNKKEESAEHALSTRERRSFLKAIGILVTIMMESNDAKLVERIRNRSRKPSAIQIAQLLLEKAEEIGLENEGLKSMDRKITEALELLEEESSPVE